MTKIKKISVKDFKAIDELEIDFKGCTAIITGGNNKGKTSFLKGVVDRIRGLRPDLAVKKGKTEGSGTIELTSGEKFIWEFDVKGTDKLTFVTKDGYETKVTKEIVHRFFPPSFDIDKFLNSSPKDQTKQLQKIIGVDFTEIDNRYKKAYDDRTEKNKEAERYQVKLAKMLVCEKVDFVDVGELSTQKQEIRTKLNQEYLANKSKNDATRKQWELEKQKVDADVDAFNKEQLDLQKFINKYSGYHQQLTTMIDDCIMLGTFIDLNALEKYINDLQKPQPIKKAVDLYPAEPTYIQELPDDKEIRDIDAKLLEVSEINAKAKAYKEFIEYKASVEIAISEAADADILVKGIEEERQKMIESTKMPEGITFGIDGEILVGGFLMAENQISTSQKYCAALRIGSMGLGEVHSLHFDASFLDKNTLAEIETWAATQGLQLLIERADWDAGEIKYELIETL